jgi:signal transduction histidine kinase
LINEILDLAKMDAGRMDWQMSDIDPRPVIEDALAATSGLFAERSIRLDVALAETLPAVHADRDRLMQVIVNLLSNAVKFCDRSLGHVIVAADSRQGRLHVRVIDNGPGVPPNDRHLIFEKFQESREKLADKPRGTGLGLAISRQIVEFFAGDIWVEDAPGHGAAFCFSIPQTGSTKPEANAVPREEVV